MRWHNLAKETKVAAAASSLIVALIVVLNIVHGPSWAGFGLLAGTVIGCGLIVLLAKWGVKEDRRIGQELDRALANFTKAELDFHKDKGHFSASPQLDLGISVKGRRLYQVAEISDDGQKALLYVSEGLHQKQAVIKAQ
jgi:hypothetical protein